MLIIENVCTSANSALERKHKTRLNDTINGIFKYDVSFEIIDQAWWSLYFKIM